MSKIETSKVTITKTVVRYTLDEYQNALVHSAAVEAGIDAGHPGLSSHVMNDGEDVVVELMVEEVAGGDGAPVDPEPEPEHLFARPNIR